MRAPPFYLRRRYIMKNRYLRYVTIIGFILIAFLLVRNLVGENNTKKDYSDERILPFEYERIGSIIKDMMERHKKIEEEFFDNLFNDDFFDKKYDPFLEIERFHRKMMKMFKDNEKNIFKNDFDEWFNKRIGLGDIKVKEFEDRIEIYIDRIKEKNVSINIKDDYIKIAYDVNFNSTSAKNGSEEKIYKSERYIKYMPMPSRFKGREHLVELKDDRIVIKFFEK